MPRSRMEEAAALRRANLSVGEISDRMGIAYATVATHLRLAKQAGIDTKPMASETVTLSLNPHVSRWLTKKTGGRSSRTDVITAIIMKAYEKDIEK